jgi:hypothetical protein
MEQLGVNWGVTLMEELLVRNLELQSLYPVMVLALP